MNLAYTITGRQEILLLGVGADEHISCTYRTTVSTLRLEHFIAEKLAANTNAITVG